LLRAVVSISVFNEGAEDGRNIVWLFKRKEKKMSAKEHSDLRQGISFLSPRVQIINRVTLFKILLIILKTAFPRIKWKS
jgi:hypothetical protein